MSCKPAYGSASPALPRSALHSSPPGGTSHMTRTIVVGYDGTDHGDDALALGRLLAGIADAELIVACAYPDDPLGESAAAMEVAQGMRGDAERKLERARDW